MRAQAITWQHALFAVEESGRVVYLLRNQREAGEFLAGFDAGRLDSELRTLLDQKPRGALTRRRARRSASPIPTGSLVGVEHEYSLFDGEKQVDFRRLIHTLPIDGVRADPSDPNAYRCTWGGVITCDGKEAEIAIPPVGVEPGFTRRVLGHLGRGEGTLHALLPDLRFEGFSTHVSVSLTTRSDRRLARRYTETFAPALMILMDRVTSPGLLVRPRPGRLEFCGEFVDGATARGVIAFAVGSVRALAHAHRNALAPLRVRVCAEVAHERYGLYVDRRAFGPDLYEAGRAAVLKRSRDGALVSAQQQLEAAWVLAREAITPDSQAEDLDAVDRMVRGEVALPCETAIEGGPRPR